ncbi:hypothetical protein NOVOSPHI9U_600010 [Novosphingobium sp. 9U]|nr:hypothetical protein NOVOSPHI9U_600010 [Novosphingobium sp. 9U]
MSILNRFAKPAQVCPECGERYIAAAQEFMPSHWQANHEAVLSWRLAWPLLRDGVYVRYAHVRPKERTTRRKLFRLFRRRSDRLRYATAR